MRRRNRVNAEPAAGVRISGMRPSRKFPGSRPSFLAAAALASAIGPGSVTTSQAAAPPIVVINEIHYDPADKRPLEFVELVNTTDRVVPLAGWALEKFAFPSNASLAAHGFIVVAQDVDAFAREFGFRPLGPLPGRLSNSGEKLSLRDPRREVIDAVSYRAGFPWPTAARGAGPSLERVRPDLPSDNPASWRSSGFPAGPAVSVVGTVFIPATDPGWRWRAGTNEASQPIAAWRQGDFVEDPSWQTGRTSIGYEDGDDNTVLTDMQGRYSSISLRHAFSIGPNVPAALLLRLRVDDGCVAWINGREVARLHVKPGPVTFRTLGENHEATEEFEDVLIEDVRAWIRPGTNWLAIQAFNASLRSSDFTIDAELRTPEGSPRGRRPTPGATNSVFSLLVPPAITSVSHTPMSPKPGQPVTVTARVEAPAPGTRLTLRLQAVEPGVYTRRSDPAFRTNWVTLAMRDDGEAGDTRAEDGVFTAVVPADWQQHRRLVRYQILAAGPNPAEGATQAPWPDDPVPNFAWFTYQGPPAWAGASRPGHTTPQMFTTEFLETIPAYHLLARGEDVEKSQWDGGANRRRFWGTLVYDGRVYDHIEFHNRGTGSAYISGKNKWGFKFNRAHEFAARDLHGRRYDQRWDSLNLNPGLSTPYLPVHAGIAGLDEAISFRAYQLAGVPSANTHWVQFRIVDHAVESSATDQYASDLHGLYLAVQDMDGSLLRERGLADGNIYSIQSGRKHLARAAVLDGSDWNSFLDGVRRDQPESWWRTNLDLPAYYSFQAISRVVGNVDLRPDGNHGYYRRPDGRWAPFPWDHDMMFVPRVHQPGHIDAIRCLSVPALKLEYQNRAREILDLFCADPSTNGGQVGQLVAELSAVLRPAGFTNDWGRLDEAVWNWHPRQNQKGVFYVNPATGHHFGGEWTRTLASPDLAGFGRYLVDFCTDARPVKNYAPNDGDARGYGYGYLSTEAKDSQAPGRPTITAAEPDGRAGRAPAFSAAPFSSPATNRFAAIQWRAAEIAAPGRPGYLPDRGWRYELDAVFTSPELPDDTARFELPATTCTAGRTYRVRARFKDHTGRWSHWSAPVEFVARGNP